MSSFPLSFRIAYRYFRANNSIQAINIISYISMFAVGVLAAAMIILLSVFNGFEHLLEDLYKAFYPDIKISAQKGKWITIDDAQLQKIAKIEGIKKLSKSAEDMVLIITDDQQRVATLKGVDDQWFSVNDFDTFVVDGARNFKDFPKANHPVIAGISIAGEIGANINNPFAQVDIYYPRETSSIGASMDQSLNSISVSPIGLFSAQAEFDDRYLVTNLASAQELFESEDRITSLEIKMNSNANYERIRNEIQKYLGSEFKIENQYEQNKTIYMVLKSEKLAIYIILSFVLLIASFTMVGVLSMIAVDKRKDMSLLRSIGGNDGLIRNIFLFKGLLLALTGGLMGIIFGVLICLGQMQFGWVKMGSGFIIDNYPVRLSLKDVFMVMSIILIVGFIASYIPALMARKQNINFREE